MKDNNGRIFARKMARELTLDEIKQVSGGWDDEPGDPTEYWTDTNTPTIRTAYYSDGTSVSEADTDPDWNLNFD